MDEQPWPSKAASKMCMAALQAQYEDNVDEASATRHAASRSVRQFQTGIILLDEEEEATPSLAPKPAFEFVDVGTSSKEEKERNRARIRSRAAMKVFRRNSTDLPSRQKKLAKSSEGQGKQHGHVTTSGESGNRPYEISALTRTPMLGRRDPFRTYPTKDYFPYADFLFDHSTAVLWPTLLPAPPNSGGRGGSFKNSWLERALSHPLPMHGLLFGAVSHINFLRKRSGNSNIDVKKRLYHKVETLRLVNEELKSPNIENIDEVLLAVLALSTNEVDDLTKENTSDHSPFHPPFSDAQWISVYGSVVQNRAHVTGMVSIVKMRGGLDNIEWPGLAATISFDIIGATQDFRHPHFPIPISAFPPQTPTEPSIPSMTELRAITTPNLGIAFSTDLLPYKHLPAAFFTAMTTLINYSVLLEALSQGLITIPSIFDLTSRRNAAQHALVSLPTGAELGLTNPEADTDFYDSLRIGAILFSVAVVFPLPPSTGVHKGLVIRLRGAVQAVALYSPSQTQSGNSPTNQMLRDELEGKGWEGAERICLWLCMLGGIASEGMVERTLFVEIVRNLVGKLELESWRAVVAEMKRWLWLDSACDCGGREFWGEVTEGTWKSASSDSTWG